MGQGHKSFLGSYYETQLLLTFSYRIFLCIRSVIFDYFPEIYLGFFPILFKVWMLQTRPEGYHYLRGRGHLPRLGRTFSRKVCPGKPSKSHFQAVFPRTANPFQTDSTSHNLYDCFASPPTPWVILESIRKFSDTFGHFWKLDGISIIYLGEILHPHGSGYLPLLAWKLYRCPGGYQATVALWFFSPKSPDSLPTPYTKQSRLSLPPSSAPLLTLEHKPLQMQSHTIN